MKAVPSTLLGIALGLGLSWAVMHRSEGERRDARETTMEETRRRSGIDFTKANPRNHRSATTEQAAAGARDFTSLSYQVRSHYLEGDPLLLRELERLDTRALRGLMENLTAEAENRKDKERLSLGSTLQAISSVLYRREGERALQWAQGLPEGKARADALYHLIGAACVQDPAAALPWFDRYKHLKWTDLYADYEWQQKIVSSAADRGAKDLLAAWEVYGERIGRMSLGPGLFYGADFDFPLFLTHRDAIDTRMGTYSMIKDWALADRDAVIREMRLQLENDKDSQIKTPYAAKEITATVIATLISTESYADATAMILEQFSDASLPQREILMASLCAAASREGGYGLNGVMASLQRDEDQRDFARVLFANFTSTPEHLGKAIGQMSSETARREALREFATKNAQFDRNKLTVILQAAGLSGEDQAEVLSRMPSAE